jgi:transposase
MDSHKRSTQLERLEVVETDRRRRWSDDEKLRIVTESFQAPRAISSTARRHGISRSLLMTWRRSFGPEPISPQGEQSGFARVILAAEVEPAVVATPPSGQMVIVVGRDRRRAKRTSILHGGQSAPLSIQAWTNSPAIFRFPGAGSRPSPGVRLSVAIERSAPN